jgi:hypothetical protein
MAAIDDLSAAIAAEDTLIDQATAFISGTPAVVAAAVAAAQANDAATLAKITADVQAHATALSTALGAPNITPTTPGPAPAVKAP